LRDAPLYAENSTEIRENLKQGNADAIRKYLPSAVLDYIKQNNLYTGE
jgi:nicotinic acid mononucleotide adenylyltransferase